jgi:UDP-glucose:(heptosyl)LPS alpha-1,3-glucosyltransferase
MSAMKIAIVRQRYNPYGGAERFVARAIAALGREGVGVTVLARDWREGGRDGGPVELLRCDPFHIGRVWRDRSFARAVCKTLAAQRFDLVQSHERIACCDVYRAGDGVHAQWLINRSRALGPIGRLGLALNPYHRYLLGAERRLFASRQLKAVICNSRMVRDQIRGHFDVPEARLHVIYNGVDLEAFHPKLRSERVGLRARLGIAADAMVYLFVGSGFERKGLPQLLNALPGLEKGELIVVGQDKRTGAMQHLAARLGLSGRVHFAGAQDDVKPWYGASDCFVLPSLYDPFPNAALEAMAAGLPVITSTQCGASECIEPGRSGAVCDALDAAGLLHCLRTINAPAKARKMGEAAREEVAGLGLDRMAVQLAELYRSLLKTETLGPDVGANA